MPQLLASARARGPAASILGANHAILCPLNTRVQEINQRVTVLVQNRCKGSTLLVLRSRVHLPAPLVPEQGLVPHCLKLSGDARCH